jgi:hypothetical protein
MSFEKTYLSFARQRQSIVARRHSTLHEYCSKAPVILTTSLDKISRIFQEFHEIFRPFPRFYRIESIIIGLFDGCVTHSPQAGHFVRKACGARLSKR